MGKKQVILSESENSDDAFLDSDESESEDDGFDFSSDEEDFARSKPKSVAKAGAVKRADKPAKAPLVSKNVNNELAQPAPVAPVPCKPPTPAKPKPAPQKSAKETVPAAPKPPGNLGTTSTPSSGGGCLGLPEHTVTTASEAAKYVLAYLQAQNRPFNAQIITDNMRGRMRKTMVESALTKLVADQEITEKVFNKAKIYWARQDRFEQVSPARLEEMKLQLQSSTAELKQLSASTHELSVAVKAVSQELSDTELDSQLAELEQQIEEKQTKVSAFKSAGVVVTAEEKKKVEGQYKALRLQWRKRKRLVNDALDRMCESMEKHSRKTLGAEMGIETDEDWNVTLGVDLV